MPSTERRHQAAGRFQGRAAARHRASQKSGGDAERVVVEEDGTLLAQRGCHGASPAPLANIKSAQNGGVRPGRHRDWRAGARH